MSTSTIAISKKKRGLFAGDNLFGYLMMTPAISVLLIFFAYPIFYEVTSSFTNKTVGQDGKWIGFANYAFLLKDATFLKACLNTVIYVSITQMGKFILGLSVALLLQQKLRGRGLIRSLVLIPYAMPGFVAYLVWKLI